MNWSNIYFHQVPTFKFLSSWYQVDFHFFVFISFNSLNNDIFQVICYFAKILCENIENFDFPRYRLWKIEIEYFHCHSYCKNRCLAVIFCILEKAYSSF